MTAIINLLTTPFKQYSAVSDIPVAHRPETERQSDNQSNTISSVEEHRVDYELNKEKSKIDKML